MLLSKKNKSLVVCKYYLIIITIHSCIFSLFGSDFWVLYSDIVEAHDGLAAKQQPSATSKSEEIGQDVQQVPNFM